MSTQDRTKVPGRDNYSRIYLRGGRVFSYAHQIESVLALEAKSVVEVGIGTGMVTAALRAIGVRVITIDCSKELSPDVVGSVTAIPIGSGAADVVLCCQVLEHLPFGSLGVAIRELARVASSAIVLSLPDARPHYELRLRLPKLRSLYCTSTRPHSVSAADRAKKWEGSGHYWEIGYPNCSLSAVRRAIEACDLQVVRTWRVSEIPYHRFFILDPRPRTQRAVLL